MKVRCLPDSTTYDRKRKVITDLFGSSEEFQRKFGDDPFIKSVLSRPSAWHLTVAANIINSDFDKDYIIEVFQTTVNVDYDLDWLNEAQARYGSKIVVDKVINLLMIWVVVSEICTSRKWRLDPKGWIKRYFFESSSDESLIASPKYVPLFFHCYEELEGEFLSRENLIYYLSTAACLVEELNIRDWLEVEE